MLAWMMDVLALLGHDIVHSQGFSTQVQGRSSFEAPDFGISLSPKSFLKLANSIQDYFYCTPCGISPGSWGQRLSLNVRTGALALAADSNLTKAQLRFSQQLWVPRPPRSLSHTPCSLITYLHPCVICGR